MRAVKSDANRLFSLTLAISVRDSSCRMQADADSDARVAYHPCVAPHDLVANPDPSRRDFHPGVVLSLVRMHAQCRSCVLRLGSHLNDHWLWRSCAGEALESARTD